MSALRRALLGDKLFSTKKGLFAFREHYYHYACSIHYAEFLLHELSHHADEMRKLAVK